MIAIAIAMKPRLLIADEPTTALDVRTQARIIDLLRRLVDEDGMGLIFITHDLALVAGLAQNIAVMRQGADRRGWCDARCVHAAEPSLHAHAVRGVVACAGALCRRVRQAGA